MSRDGCGSHERALFLEQIAALDSTRRTVLDNPNNGRGRPQTTKMIPIPCGGPVPGQHDAPAPQCGVPGRGSENGSSGNGQSGSGSSNGNSSDDGSGGEGGLQDFPSSTMVVTSTPPSELL
jgi:hypothetical protein